VNFTSDFFFGRVPGYFPQSHTAVLVLLPAIGGVLVGTISQVLARGQPVPGIPFVMESLARRGGRLSGRAGLLQALNSALTIGSGGSAGMEGPIIHIGSTVGSLVGRSMRLTRQHMHTLVG